MNICNILSRFGMEPENGLVLTSSLKDAAVNEFELLAILEAQKFKATAVYFRRFEDHSRSIPQVYIYESDFSTDELAEIHTNLWSSGVVPLFYVVTPTEVKIFNCTKSVEFTHKHQPITQPIEQIKWVGAIQKELEAKKISAKRFDNGTFWEEHPTLLEVASSPYQRLLNGLLKAKKDLTSKQTQLSDTTIRKLLVMGILVKYLEAKSAGNGVHLLAISRDFYNQFPECKEFTAILRQKQVVPFFEALNRTFNGNVFNLKTDEKEQLRCADLNAVADVFDANIENGQYVLWKLYSFHFLPIELISGIYEAFLTEKQDKGVVYTPPYLVNWLIDECMPLHEAQKCFHTGTFRVLDPACGSGIFLVAALKRMVQWQTILDYEATGKMAYPNLETVKKILKKNLYGIDIAEDATQISIFSLCIALCDKLSLLQIWNELRFDDLQIENIRTADFFEIYPQLQKQSFDLVLGNPPFNPPIKFTNKSYLKYVKEQFGITPQFPLNDDHIALFFWDKAVELSQKTGKICFILPSSAWLYNHNSIDYRRFFMTRYQVEKIIDFTHLSDKLFHGTANVAVCAVIATRQSKQIKDLLHVVVKRSKVAEERYFFEIDHYDFHKVSAKMAMDNPFIWKCNLLGGGRLPRLIHYLSQQRTLGAFLETQKASGWVVGEGYIIGHDGTKSEQELSEAKYSKADWITQKKTIDTNCFTKKGYSTKIESENYFLRHRASIKNIFEPPHILIKENLERTGIPMAFSEEYLCFKDRLIGIHAPPSQTAALRTVFNHLETNSLLNHFFVLAISGELGISRWFSVLQKTDIMNLPYPENPTDLQLSRSEKAIQEDVLNYHAQLKTKSLESSLNQAPKDHDLKEFGDLFCDTLNPIYERDSMKWFVRGFQTESSVTMYVFCYGKPQSNPLPSIFEGGLNGMETLIYNETKRNVRIHKVLRAYLHIDNYDILILMKPKAIRYWLKSIALRDADETFSDLKINGF
jgi:type I restriction-modification system DNA methylase subunit